MYTKLLYRIFLQKLQESDLYIKSTLAKVKLAIQLCKSKPRILIMPLPYVVSGIENTEFEIRPPDYAFFCAMHENNRKIYSRK
jgi:hypothetical protein